MFSRIFRRAATKSHESTTDSTEPTEENVVHVEESVSTSQQQTPTLPTLTNTTSTAKRSASVMENSLPPVAPAPKLARYELDENEDGKIWELREAQAIYLNKYLANHVNSRQIKEKILDETPAPINIKKVPVLDTHIKELLQEHSKLDAPDYQWGICELQLFWSSAIFNLYFRDFSLEQKPYNSNKICQPLLRDRGNTETSSM